MKIFQVAILNNYFTGRYFEYGAKYYNVLATNPDEAKEVVLKFADVVLADMKTRRYNEKRKLLGKYTLPITEKCIGLIKEYDNNWPTKPVTLLSLDGPMEVVKDENYNLIVN